METYYVQLNNNTITGVLFGGRPDENDDTWIEIQSDVEPQVGMEYNANKLDNNKLLWEEVRLKRNALLSASDWTQLPDVVANGRLTTSQVSAMAEYRQILADIPQNFEDPNDVVFPAHPLET